MPLYDWVVLNKSLGRDIVRPEQTAGGKRFDRSDPETMEMLRKLYDHAQTELPEPGPPPEPNPPFTIFSRILDFVTRGKDITHVVHRSRLENWRIEKENYALWTGPFETVVDHHADESPGKIIIPTAPDRVDALGQFQNFNDSPYAFGLHSLLPDYNDVTYYAETELEEFDFAFGLMLVEAPEQLLEMASTLETALNAYNNAERNPDPGSVKAVEYGIRWLRFRGGHGHRLRTDVRGVVDTAEGVRFIVETT